MSQFNEKPSIIPGCPGSWDSMHTDDDLQTKSSLHINWGLFVVSDCDSMHMDAENAQNRHHVCSAGMSVALQNAPWQAWAVGQSGWS